MHIFCYLLIGKRCNKSLAKNVLTKLLHVDLPKVGFILFVGSIIGVMFRTITYMYVNMNILLS